MERSIKKMRACIALMVLAVVLVGCSLDGGTGTGSGSGGDQATSCGPQSLDFQSGQAYQLNGSPIQLSGKTQLDTPYGSLTLADGCRVKNVGGGGVDVVYVRLYCDGTQITNYVGIPMSYLKVPVDAQTKHCVPYVAGLAGVCFLTVWIGWSWQGFIPADQPPHQWFDPPKFQQGA